MEMVGHRLQNILHLDDSIVHTKRTVIPFALRSGDWDGGKDRLLSRAVGQISLHWGKYHCTELGQISLRWTGKNITALHWFVENCIAVKCSAHHWTATQKTAQHCTEC